MTKITSLTDTQQASLVQYRDKWLSIGLDTTPIDKEAARSAVEQAWENLGM